MIHFVINQKLWTLIIPAGDSYVVLLVWEEEISEAPVDQAELFGVIIDNNVQRLDIAMHDTVRVRKL